jgi:hypothetical protein
MQNLNHEILADSDSDWNVEEENRNDTSIYPQ